MANPEHLKKLKEGVEAWNRWREENSDVFPDLAKASLKGENFSRSNLIGADLSKAELSDVNLRMTDLIGADLSAADLVGADLGEANLNGANLYHADLFGTNLSGAKLIDTMMEYAYMGRTNLSNLKLDLAKGIEKVQHDAPSSLGIDTIKLSEGKLPKVFLQGCGLSPWEIEIARLYNPDLSPSDVDEILATKIYQKRIDGPLYIGGVFISYSHADNAFVDKVYNELRSYEIPVWLDKHDMLAGNIERQVMRQIRLKDIVVMVLSENSISSDWVETELEEARNKEKAQGRDVLCPIAIDDSWQGMQGVLWRKLKRDKHILDFSVWKTKGEFKRQFDKLIKGMQINY